MEPTAFRIKDWKAHFEKGHKPREVNFRWVAMPTKHDGKGFRRLSRLPNAANVFCGWCLIVQEAAKMPIRGVLIDESGPITAADLSDSTGFAENVFAETLLALSDRSIGINWLDPIPFGEVSGLMTECSAILSGCYPDMSGQRPDDIRTRPDTVRTSPPSSPDMSGYSTAQDNTLQDSTAAGVPLEQKPIQQSAQGQATYWLTANRPHLLKYASSFAELITVAGSRDAALEIVKPYMDGDKSIRNPFAYAMPKAIELAHATGGYANNRGGDGAQNRAKPSPASKVQPGNWKVKI